MDSELNLVNESIRCWDIDVCLRKKAIKNANTFFYYEENYPKSLSASGSCYSLYLKHIFEYSKTWPKMDPLFWLKSLYHFLHYRNNNFYTCFLMCKILIGSFECLTTSHVSLIPSTHLQKCTTTWWKNLYCCTRSNPYLNSFIF